eukprot:17112-Rhodomonas_salina.1
MVDERVVPAQDASAAEQNCAAGASLEAKKAQYEADVGGVKPPEGEVSKGVKVRRLQVPGNFRFALGLFTASRLERWLSWTKSTRASGGGISLSQVLFRRYPSPSMRCAMLGTDVRCAVTRNTCFPLCPSSSKTLRLRR